MIPRLAGSRTPPILSYPRTAPGRAPGAPGRRLGAQPPRPRRRRGCSRPRRRAGTPRSRASRRGSPGSPRGGAFGHEPHRRRGDVEVALADDEPRRPGAPRRSLVPSPSVSARSVTGRWVDAMRGRLAGVHIGAELLVVLVVGDPDLVAPGGHRVRDQRARQGAALELAGQQQRALAGVRGERRDVDQRAHGLQARRRLGDHHAAVGVADEDDRPADALDHVAHVGGVPGQSAQRVGDGDGGQAAAVQARDDAVPARRLGEGPVDQDDGGPFGAAHGFFPSVSVPPGHRPGVVRAGCATCGAARQPVGVLGLAERRAVARHEVALPHLGAEVVRVRVGDDPARVVPRRQGVPEELVHPEPLGAADLDRAVQRRAHRHPADVLGHLVARHGLEEHRRHPHRVAVRGLVRDPAGELEELRRVHDRERDRRVLISSSWATFARK